MKAVEIVPCAGSDLSEEADRDDDEEDDDEDMDADRLDRVPAMSMPPRCAISCCCARYSAARALASSVDSACC